MRIGVQLTGHDNPEDWHFIDSADWMTFAPGRSIFAILGPGTPMAGYDHYAVEDIDGACHITIWNDRPNDTPPAGAAPAPKSPDEYYARKYIFHGLKPDIRLGGAYNSRADHIVYAAPKAMQKLNQNQEGVVFLPWANFEKPRNVRDGEWLSDPQAEAHEQAQSRHSWKEWIDGVPIHLVENGKLKPQRSAGLFPRADGTRTYFLTNATQAANVHILISNELQATVAVGGGQTVTESIKKNDDELAFAWYSPSNEPNEATWTTGQFRVSMDASTVGADITFGLNTQSGTTGHFAAVNSALSADQATATMTQNHTSPAGIKVSSVTTTIANGAQSDRVEALIAAVNANAMNNQDLAIDCTSDSWIDGPWAAAAGADQFSGAKQFGQVDPPAFLFGPEVIGYQDGGRYDKDD